MHRYILYARKSQEDEGRQQQSIGDQLGIMTQIAERDALLLVERLTEERSAKEPYLRPVFDHMIAAIQAGDADAILCYHANRLARNMVEGGLLQHLLTKGVLKEIRTYNEVFRTGDNILPFVLQAAMSTQYSLDLSQHVRRGTQSKMDKGGYPHRAPEGYTNNRLEKTIEVDPGRFPIIRKAWELMLTGTYSVDRIERVLTEEWGYRTRPGRKIGGGHMCRASVHRMFRNVFYTGHFLHDGELYKGNHEPMVTMDEFRAVQEILRRGGHSRQRTLEFAYTGLIVCAKCGRQVTAEQKRGYYKPGNYVYYHCTNYTLCRSRSVRQEVLEDKIDALLRSVSIDPAFRKLAVQVIERCYAEESETDHTQHEQLDRELEAQERRMSRLIQMSLDEMLTDTEFRSAKQELQESINRLRIKIDGTKRSLENARDGALEVARFVSTTPYEFAGADIERRREIARKLGITYRLRDGELEAELHPLLVPLCSGLIETPRSLVPCSGSPVSAASAQSVANGGAVETLIERFREVWKLLLEGAPRLFYVAEETERLVEVEHGWAMRV